MSKPPSRKASGAGSNPAAKRQVRQPLKPWQAFALAAAALYVLLTAFFAPVVFQGMTLSPAADMVAAAGMFRMGEEAIRHLHFPLWNPTLFCGLPLFASLQYALFTYPPEFLIRLFSHIFGFGDYRIWVFHFFMAGIFAYLLARHYGCGRLTSWLAGVAYGFSPQLIVLADVGHGSKLMAMTWLPLIWLALERLRRSVLTTPTEFGAPRLEPPPLIPPGNRGGDMRKPMKVGAPLFNAAILGVVFAVEILALHPQVAAYGAMLMALFLIYYGVGALRDKRLADWLKLVAHWAGAMALSLLLSAVLWMSVLDYARYSNRGGGDTAVAGGGVTWEYATGWSFHPLESITYLFPNFTGFGNETYWGSVGTPAGQPFTHNPMYFGFLVLLLAALALFLLPRRKWGFPLLLGIAALVLSFGKYLPILYGPFFHLLPLFNKFRAPVMGQVLLLLPMALLAAQGLEELLRRAQSKESKGNLPRTFAITAGIAGGLAVIFLLGGGLFGSIYASYANLLKPGTNPDLLRSALSLARPDVLRVLGLIFLCAGLAWLALRGKLVWQALAGVLILVLVADLWQVDRKLVTFTPKSYTRALFQPEELVKAMQGDEDKFRLHPLDGRYRAVNWWSYFGIESTIGYFGAKPADYQRLMSLAGLEGWGAVYSNPTVLDALNVRYIVSSAPLEASFAELARRGAGAPARPASDYQLVARSRGGGYLYRNPDELPRVRLVDHYRQKDTLEDVLMEMVAGRWDPKSEALLLERPSVHPIEGGGEGKAVIIEYQPEYVRIDVNIPLPRIMVLADAWYPSGWKATVDGKPAQILRADGVLRAVALPAGRHRVEFAFKPKWFYAGLGVSGGAVLILLAGFAFSLLRKRRGIRPD